MMRRERMPMAELDEVKAACESLFENPVIIFPDWLLYVRVIPQCGPVLARSLAALESLELPHDVNRELLMDLIAHGEGSETYAQLCQMWDIMAGVPVNKFVPGGEDHNSDVVRSAAALYFNIWLREAYGDLVGEQIVVSRAQVWLRSMAKVPQGDSLGVALRMCDKAATETARGLASELRHGFLRRSLLSADASRESGDSPNARIRHLHSALRREEQEWRGSNRLYPGSLTWQLLRGLGGISWEKLYEFEDCVDEYNLEWAMASFDWEEDGEELAKLQAFLDESPWSEEMRGESSNE